MAATWVEPVTLQGSIVRLEPLSLEHVEGLAEVAFGEPSVWRWTCLLYTSDAADE